MVSKTHEIEKQVDTLVSEARSTDTRVNNVYNDFVMLSNIQFVESVSTIAILSLCVFVCVCVCVCVCECVLGESMHMEHSMETTGIRLTT